MENTDHLIYEIENRLFRIQKEMQKMQVDACVLNMNINLYYLTGRVFNGYYFIPVEGQPILFVKRPIDYVGENVVFIRKPEQMADFFIDNQMKFPSTLLLETDEMPYNECVRLQTIFKEPQIGNATSLLRKIREIKSDWEISQLRISAKKHTETYKTIQSCYREGMTDVELQLEIEKQMRLNGSVGIFHAFGANMDIFMGSILAGKNAEVPTPFDFALGGLGQSPLCPIGANGTRLAEGMAVMIDMAGNYTPYMTDMTRVFSVGKLSELAYRAHQVSLDIQDEIMNLAKPGFSCAEIYEKAIRKVESEGLANYFMGTRQQAKFVGHGLGLQINEPPVFTPRSKEILLSNMVFALEPKFVIPQVGAVGIENTFLVTESGIDKITQFEEQIILLA